MSAKRVVDGRGWGLMDHHHISLSGRRTVMVMVVMVMVVMVMVIMVMVVMVIVMVIAMVIVMHRVVVVVCYIMSNISSLSCMLGLMVL